MPGTSPGMTSGETDVRYLGRDVDERRAAGSLHRQISPADVLVPGESRRILAMHHLALVDDQRLLGDPQTEMHVLFGEQDRGAAGAQFAERLADGGDHDRGQSFARLIK